MVEGWGLRESLKPSYFEAFLALTALFLDVGVVGYTFKQVKHDKLIRTVIRTIRTLDELYEL